MNTYFLRNELVTYMKIETKIAPLYGFLMEMRADDTEQTITSLQVY